MLVFENGKFSEGSTNLINGKFGEGPKIIWGQEPLNVYLSLYTLWEGDGFYLFVCNTGIYVPDFQNLVKLLCYLQPICELLSKAQNIWPSETIEKNGGVGDEDR